MELTELKLLRADQEIVRSWLESIGETDELQIKETMDLMRTKPEYRQFILDYAKGSK